MKTRLLFLLVFILIIGSVVYWWRVTSYGYEHPGQAPMDSPPVADSMESGLTFGILESNTDAEEFSAFLQNVDAEFADANIGSAEVRSFESVVEAARAMRQGRIDIFFGSSFGAYEVARLAGGDVLLERVLEDGYRTVFYAPSDTDYDQNLTGATIAFGNEHSTLLFLLPLAELRARGIDVVESKDVLTTPGATTFAIQGSAMEIEQAVISGVADAGVATDGDIPRPGGTRFVELLSTRQIAGDSFAFSDRIPEDQRDAITQIFTNTNDTSEGRLMLSKFDGTKEFRLIDSSEEWLNTVYLSSFIEREILH